MVVALASEAVAMVAEAFWNCRLPWGTGLPAGTVRRAVYVCVCPYSSTWLP